jgi:hypothetical protein
MSKYAGLGSTLQQTALQLALASHAAYEDHFDPSEIGCRWATKIQAAHQVAWLLGDDRHQLILAVRGTDDREDLISSLLSPMVERSYSSRGYLFNVEGRVHAGYAADAGALIGGVVSALQQHHGDHSLLWVTGHSLGGALAQLLAVELMDLNYNVAGVHCFGSPNVGDSGFARSYNASMGRMTYRYVYHADPVPFFPPWFYGYRACGRLLWYDHTRWRRGAPWWYRLRKTLFSSMRHRLDDHTAGKYVAAIAAADMRRGTRRGAENKAGPG